MNWLKRIAKILLGLLGAIVVILLVFAGINLIDEDLNPAVKPLLEVPAMTLAPERNGYLYLVGFGADADKNPTPWARRLKRSSRPTTALPVHG